MISDKLSWARMQSIAGMGFVAWGLANATIFGLSLVMSKENFDYHFAYRGTGKLTQPLKANMAAESLNNVAWTAPSLIFGGMYLNSRVGPLLAMKIFGLSVFAAYGATCTLGPASIFRNMHLRSLSPIRWDSIDAK